MASRTAVTDTGPDEVAGEFGRTDADGIGVAIDRDKPLCGTHSEIGSRRAIAAVAAADATVADAAR